MNDWAYTLCPMWTRQLLNPHASMEVPVADLKWDLGGKGCKGGILSIYTVWSSCNSREVPVSISAKHLTPFNSTGMCAPLYPHSVLYLIFFPLPSLAFTVAPSCLNCHWGPPSSTCSSPEVSPVVPSGSESVGRSANSSVS